MNEDIKACILAGMAELKPAQQNSFLEFLRGMLADQKGGAVRE